MKKFRYLIEAALVNVLIAVFRALPLDKASTTGGAIGRLCGKIMASSRKANRHLRLSLPGKSDRDYSSIIQGMWDNLGRVFAEYPHLHDLSAKGRVEVVGIENLGNMAQTNEPAIFFSGHLANWELSAPSLRTLGINIDLIYRPPNNPWVEQILQRCRSMDGRLQTYPKSRTGMRQVMEALKAGRRIGILIDQKYNQGVEADFFGRPAMTSPAFIQLAQKFNCPLIPVRIERRIGSHFRVTIYPPLDTTKPLETLLKEAHTLLEDWIAQQPSQWLWLHRRWK